MITSGFALAKIAYSLIRGYLFSRASISFSRVCGASRNPGNEHSEGDPSQVALNP